MRKINTVISTHTLEFPSLVMNYLSENKLEMQGSTVVVAIRLTVQL